MEKSKELVGVRGVKDISEINSLFLNQPYIHCFLKYPYSIY